jgi:tryptophan synthase alpha chain
MNRIDQKFKDLKKENKAAFIAFLTAGFPSLSVTKDLILAFEQAGVDVVEIGVPFSDPLADGPTIQASSQAALKKGVTLPKIFKLVEAIRRHSQIPLCLMTYYNPVFHYGEEGFVDQAILSGVDGLIVPDLPSAEAQSLIARAHRRELDTIFFVAPTTTPARIKLIDKASSGFIYYVSTVGVTGQRQSLSKDLVSHLTKVRAQVKNRVCVGFGVSTPEQVKEISHHADGVIVGSAIIQAIKKHQGCHDLVNKVAGFVQGFAKQTRR